MITSNTRRGFTLIELLVGVLIIGILAAVALPQYQKAVEKVRMTEAVLLVKQIAQAHQAYYLEHGTWLGATEWDKLPISIPGEKIDSSYGIGANRIRTAHFVYSPNASTKDWLAGAYRVTDNADGSHTLNYRIWITQDEPNRVQCTTLAPTAAQRTLCTHLNDTGAL